MLEFEIMGIHVLLNEGDENESEMTQISTMSVWLVIALRVS